MRNGIWRFTFWTLCMGIVAQSLAAMEDWESWPIEKLEKEMSPSRWNPTKSPDEVIQEYVQVSIDDTQKAQKDLPCELNIPYGAKSSQKYDVYGKNLSENAPTFFWIHGGYWQEGSKDISGLLAPNLVKNGMRNIVLGYTLAPNATVGEIEKEMMMALKHAMKKYPTSKFIVGGHSAGAQLSAMLLHTNKGFPELYRQLSGLVLVSGVYDLRLLVPAYVNDNLKMTKNDAEALSPLRIRTINPSFVEKASEFQILITVSNYDSPEFQRQAHEYHKLLGSTLHNSEFWKSESDDHFTVVQNMAKDTSAAGKRLGGFVNEFKTRSGSSHLTALPLTILSAFLVAVTLFF